MYFQGRRNNEAKAGEEGRSSPRGSEKINNMSD